ncbi:hypothetical protein KC19_1G022600 [Ceratodon purpureus]|uniref:Uncharacterized protein n=1 Tax=Ceratodon purpureus TaxID=3225 RepID=A0A8T0J0J3_CERPU|nr:hypothetical protein KC19_1G022600 [Ceratodon purpureus]
MVHLPDVQQYLAQCSNQSETYPNLYQIVILYNMCFTWHPYLSYYPHLEVRISRWATGVLSSSIQSYNDGQPLSADPVLFSLHSSQLKHVVSNSITGYFQHVVITHMFPSVLCSGLVIIFPAVVCKYLSHSLCLQ